MSALERIRRRLGALHLYHLDGTGLVEGELEAYQAAFAPVEALLEETARAAFPALCTPELLSRWEKLLEIPQRPGRTPEERRRIVCSKLAITPADCTVQGLLNAVRGAGLEARLVEDPPSGAIQVTDASSIGEFDQLDQIKSHVGAMLPAHLEVLWDIGVLTWEMLDRKELTFRRWDALDFTWQWFDINGEKLPNGEE